MAEHNELGKKGEAEAIAYLKKNGFNILEVNWRFKKAEIDIIATEGDKLVFVEVKTRRPDALQEGELAVNIRKQGLLIRAAAGYYEEKAHAFESRFDIITVMFTGRGAEINHIREAFYPPLG